MSPRSIVRALAGQLRAQIVREHHTLLEERIRWQSRAQKGAPGGLMTPRVSRLRSDDPLEQLWALPARVPDARRV